MEYKITMAEVCELAHAYTRIECVNKGIKPPSEQGDDYTTVQQAIFDKHFTLITDKLGV